MPETISTEQPSVLRFSAGRSTLLHTESAFFMLYIEKGTCSLQAGSFDRVFRAGDLCLVATDLAFLLSVDPQSEAIAASIPLDSLNSVFTELVVSNPYLSEFIVRFRHDPDPVSVLLFHTEQDPEFIDHFHRMEEEACSTLPYAGPMVFVYLYLILVTLLRAYTPAVLSPSGETDRHKDLSPILTYIREHYTNVSLSALSRHFSYSERHISRMLLEGTGQTLGRIITGLKMKKASDLLMDPRLSSAQIANMLGYADLSTFYKAFKRTYHTNPSDYRKNRPDQSITSSTGQ